MKKIMYVILLALSIVWASHADSFELLNPLSMENTVLREQLEHETGLKNHYQKMAVYSERETELKNIELENQIYFTETLKYLIDNERVAYIQLKADKDSIIKEQSSIILNLESTVATNAQNYFEELQVLALKEIKYVELESKLEREAYYRDLFILGLAICLILYLIQKAFLSLRASKKPKTKKDKKLKIVPKSDGGAQVDPEEETATPIKEDKKNPPKGKPVTNPKPETKKDKRKREQKGTEIFSLFIDDIKRKKDIKKKNKLEKLRAEALKEKPGDITETESIKEVNTKLAKKGGALSGMIKAIMLAKAPKVKAPVEETPVEEKPTVKKETVPKKQVKRKKTPAKPNRSSRGNRGNNGKNNQNKPTTEQKDKK